MTSTTELEELTAFAKRLEAERRRIVDQLMATAANKPLDPDLLRQLSNLQGAWMALAAEIEAHTPTMGRGGET
jgi:predicted outer membrane protein